MASKSEEDFLADQRTAAGGKVQLRSSSVGSKRSSTIGLSSGGESSRSSSDDDLQGYVVKKNVVHRQADTVEYCAALGRPDPVTTLRQIPGTSLEDFVVRTSETTTHVLVMGSPSMLFYPLQCPFKQERCESFRAHAPQYLKEHLESKHYLHSVQVNLACPCPSVCNVVNGEALECQAVKYDPIGGVLETHIQRRHSTYFDKMGHSLCLRNEKEENMRDVSEEVKNYVKYLDTGKKLPAWTSEDPRRSLFPSQVFPEKVILQAVIEEKKVLYKCNIPPCRGERAMVEYGMSVHLRREPGHLDRMGFGWRIFEQCPTCEVQLHWSAKKMMLHVRAMHPELLDETSHFSEAAKAELAKLVGLIKGKIIGRAIGETAKRGDESDGTKAHCLYCFRCHMPNCKKIFSERDHLEWHIKADHQAEWNKEEVKKYVQYLETGKKLPAWTMGDPRGSLFPSQVFPEKIILQAVIEDKRVLYKCNIPPCRGERAMVEYGMSVHLGEEPGHLEKMGHGWRIFVVGIR